MTARALVVDGTNIPESRHLALALREAGYDVDFHCSFEFDPTSAVARALRVIARSDDTSLGSLLERRRRPAFYPLQPRNWYLPDLLVAIARRSPLPTSVAYLLNNLAADLLASRLLARKPDVVVLRQGSAFWTLSRARTQGVRSILLVTTPDPFEEHGLVEAERLAIGLPVERVDGPTLRLWERIRREYALADRILAQSRFAGDSVVRSSGREIEAIGVVPMGCDVALTKARGARSRGPVRALFVGSISVRKGVHYAVQAVRELRLEGLPVELDVVGSCDDPRYERFLAPMLGDGVRMGGPVPSHLLADQYARADVLVLPSLSDGFGMVVTEAKAASLPAIVTDRCGVPVRDGEDGFVVPAGNGGALKEALRRLVEDGALRARMGLAARASAEALSWTTYRAEAMRLLHAGDILRPRSAKASSPRPAACERPEIFAGARRP